MLYSEFREVLEEALGSTWGRSVLVDLYLPRVGMTGAEALERGIEPREVWAGLVDELDLDPDLLWLHRADPRKRAPRR